METVPNDMETGPNEFSIKNHQNVLLTNPVFLRIVVLKNVTCCGEGYTFKFGDFLVAVFLGAFIDNIPTENQLLWKATMFLLVAIFIVLTFLII